MSDRALTSSTRRTARKISKRLTASPAVDRGLTRLESALARRRTPVKNNAARAVAPVVARLDKLEATVATLAKQDVPMLRDGLQEQRGLSNRISELADVVTELLVLAAQRDDPEFARIVARYREGI